LTTGAAAVNWTAAICRFSAAALRNAVAVAIISARAVASLISTSLRTASDVKRVAADRLPQMR
jgi:hypothetical protein